MYRNDNRIVITLDAGGTNFVFSAMRGYDFIIEPITYPSNAQDLDLCLQTMLRGFREVIAKLNEKPVAVSFAFPGPADYRRGIIGGYLPNFPSLERELNLPVYINNDGDLFALGEAKGGMLPEINHRVKELGGKQTYTNLLGYTFGTGFGIGSVINGQLNQGNNCCIETFCLPNKRMPGIIAEEGVAIRAIKREYARLSGTTDPSHRLPCRYRRRSYWSIQVHLAFPFGRNAFDPEDYRRTGRPAGADARVRSGRRA